MGIRNPIDMVVGDPEAEAKYQKNLIGYSQEKNEGKVEKEGAYVLFAGLRRCARGVLEQHRLHWLRNLGIRASCAALAAH